MGKLNLKDIVLTPLKQIPTGKGSVYHGIKASENTFEGFGEAYLSFVDYNTIKGWKLHKRMTLNLVVPIGLVKFVIFSPDTKMFAEHIIGENNYQRLTVPPGYWMAFQGMDRNNIILNIANIEHVPFESEKKEIQEIDYEWK